MTHAVDTHALVWFLEGNSRLSAPARDVLADPGTKLIVPTIVLAEVTFLYAKKRVSVDVNQVLDHLDQAGNCTVYPLDESVVRHLPAELDIHDAIIVATGIVFRDVLGESVAVVTRDEKITESGLIDTVW